MEISNDVPLAPMTTMGVGGLARHFVKAATVEDLRAAIRWGRSRAMPFVVLGGGSNVIVEDSGFPGLVVQPALRGRRLDFPASASVEVTASAGESWDDLVAFAVGNGLQGIECLSGIPGSVGAAPLQNVGAYGQEVGDVLASVEVLDTHDDVVRHMEHDECRLGYRSSRFKSADAGRFVVLAVRLRLARCGTPTVRYDELARRLAQAGTPSPSLAQVRHCVLDLRERKGMVWDPAKREPRSVGSFFVNPALAQGDLQALEERAHQRGLLGRQDRVPAFKMPDGRSKVPAAWLIEGAGYHRGHTRERVGLSPQHALAIVARDAATALDVLSFAQEIETAVLDAFGLQLVREAVTLGAATTLAV